MWAFRLRLSLAQIFSWDNETVLCFNPALHKYNKQLCYIHSPNVINLLSDKTQQAEYQRLSNHHHHLYFVTDKLTLSKLGGTEVVWGFKLPSLSFFTFLPISPSLPCLYKHIPSLPFEGVLAISAGNSLIRHRGRPCREAVVQHRILDIVVQLLSLHALFISLLEETWIS